MSNSGNKHTSLAKQKIGITKKVDRAKIDESVNKYISSLTKADFPSLTDAALYAGISEKTLIRYEMSTEEDSNIRRSLDEIRDRQKSWLISNGLSRKTDSRITGMLLEANHGVNKQAPALTQNNFFSGLTPELLSDALALSRSQKPAQSTKQHK